MKILAGSNKGRYLKVARSGMRPTKAIVRSAIFNILNTKIDNAKIIDIFAGTGALGIESLSRGAQFCVFIENHPAALIENIRKLNLRTSTMVIKQDFRPALKRLHGMKFDIAFIDPPYKTEFILETLRLLYFYELLTDEGIVIAEYTHFNRLTKPEEYITLREKRYGDTLISFLGINYNKKE
jgi:16S rRNA (guanine(966)-N(2))-methyltransferase RsmD